MAEKQLNRWLILISSVLINLCIGAAYAWSVFQKPLIQQFGWSTSEASLAFTLSLGLVPLAMIVAGKLQDQIGPKRVILAGGIIFSLGLIGAGFTNSITHLYLTYGLLGGIGIGTIYACTVANTVKFFPDKRGLASGLVAAGFGSGAMIIAPLATMLIQSVGVLTSFMYLGIAFLILISLFSQFVQTAPAGYKPTGWNPPAAASTTASGSVDKNWREMLSEPIFYVLWVMYTVGCISGLMIIGHAAPIAMEVIKVDAVAASTAVVFLALANTAGRIFWGSVSDKIGRYPALIAMFVVAAVMMFTLQTISTYTSFVAVVATLGLCFGGFMGIFPSITADMFGAKNLGMNYGIIFTAYGAAAVIGPRLASYFKEINQGDYSQAFLIAAALSILGVILTFYAQYSKKKQEQKIAIQG